MNLIVFRKYKYRKGFTLIELLVVIAVIAILAGLMLPALALSKNKAKQIHCLSNMKQMGMGLILSSEDFDGVLPPTAHLSLRPENIWINTLAPYVGDVNEIRFCKSDPKKALKQKQIQKTINLILYFLHQERDLQLPHQQ